MCTLSACVPGSASFLLICFYSTFPARLWKSLASSVLASYLPFRLLRHTHSCLSAPPKSPDLSCRLLHHITLLRGPVQTRVSDVPPVSLVLSHNLSTLTTDTADTHGRRIETKATSFWDKSRLIADPLGIDNLQFRRMPFITLGMTVPFEATGIVPPPPGIHPLPMSRPQVGIERLPARRMSNEPRESMNCKSCRKRKV